jgi:hypothetical protein
VADMIGVTDTISTAMTFAIQNVQNPIKIDQIF